MSWALANPETGAYLVRQEDVYRFGSLQPGIATEVQAQRMWRGLMRGESGIGLGWDCAIPVVLALGLIAISVILRPEKRT